MGLAWRGASNTRNPAAGLRICAPIHQIPGWTTQSGCLTVLEDGTIIVRVKNRSIGDISFKPPGGKRVSIARMTR
jgi:hypothetical protein